jgi:miniconductance mechanosensitive channel
MLLPDNADPMLQSAAMTSIQGMPVWAVLGLIVAVALLLHWALHRMVLVRLRTLVENSPREWPRALIARQAFDRAALTIQGVVVLAQARVWLESGELARGALEAGAQVWIVLFATLSLFAMLDGVGDLVQRSERSRQLPLRGIFQSVKLVAAIMAVVLTVSVLIGQSPLILLSGLGAMTAVLMLVFRDPIMGLVAGIQLSVNDMLRVGDWLEMPKFGADGDVTDIGLTTVKVRNWDNTITTIPTYALIADSFKNWRGMSESGGRRIKRSVMIDATSVRFLEPADLERLHRGRLLAEYLDTKVSEIERYNQEIQSDLACLINGRRLTNIGTFRAYLSAYLQAHPHIHKGMMLMVRQLAPGPDGIPMELYCFTTTTRWVEYESIQGDIFDHILAVLAEFGLRMHQSPTGYDMRQIGQLPATGDRAS